MRGCQTNHLEDMFDQINNWNHEPRYHRIQLREGALGTLTARAGEEHQTEVETVSVFVGRCQEMHSLSKLTCLSTFG